MMPMPLPGSRREAWLRVLLEVEAEGGVEDLNAPKSLAQLSRRVTRIAQSLARLGMHRAGADLLEVSLALGELERQMERTLSGEHGIRRSLVDATRQR